MEREVGERGREEERKKEIKKERDKERKKKERKDENVVKLNLVFFMLESSRRNLSGGINFFQEQ